MHAQLIDGAIIAGTEATVDLVSSVTTPTAITPNAAAAFINIRVAVEAEWVWAASASAGNTAITAASCIRVGAGIYAIANRGQNGNVLCVRSSGSASTKGLSHWQSK